MTMRQRGWYFARTVADQQREQERLEAAALIDNGMALLCWIASHPEGLLLSTIAAQIELRDWQTIGRLYRAWLIEDLVAPGAEAYRATVRGDDVASELIRISDSLNPPSEIAAVERAYHEIAADGFNAWLDVPAWAWSNLSARQMIAAGRATEVVAALKRLAEGAYI